LLLDAAHAGFPCPAVPLLSLASLPSFASERKYALSVGNGWEIREKKLVSVQRVVIYISTVYKIKPNLYSLLPRETSA